MAHCLSCHSYVANEHVACASCSGTRNPLRVVRDTDTYGLHSREWNFRYKMIKGKIAETLIEQLFLSHKYTVFRYGITDKIRNMPDFVVQHRLYKETYFVEVKYRADGCFCVKDLDKDYPYDDALIIVVSKSRIKCLSVRELKDGIHITHDCTNYLANRPEFQLRRDVVVDFCRFAEMFFERSKNV
jgi:hypothetical protein